MTGDRAAETTAHPETVRLERTGHAAELASQCRCRLTAPASGCSGSVPPGQILTETMALIPTASGGPPHRWEMPSCRHPIPAPANAVRWGPPAPPLTVRHTDEAWSSVVTTDLRVTTRCGRPVVPGADPSRDY